MLLFAQIIEKAISNAGKFIQDRGNRGNSAKTVGNRGNIAEIMRKVQFLNKEIYVVLKYLIHIKVRKPHFRTMKILVQKETVKTKML